MTPQTFKLFLDVATLFMGVYVMFLIAKTSIGGLVGGAFMWIMAGFFILTVNHLMDTLFLADLLKSAGHTADFWQSSIIHRMVNFFGFLSILIGFFKITKAQS